jgi:hypothetical protein
MLKTHNHSLEGQKVQLEGQGSARAPYVAPRLHSEGSWNHITADLSFPFTSPQSQLIERDITSNK